MKDDHDFEVTLKLFKKQPDLQRALSLLSHFGRKGSLDTVFDIYKILISHSLLNIDVLKLLMDICLKWNQPKRVLTLLDDMNRHSIPLDGWCFSMFVRACAKIGDVVTARKLFEKMRKKEFKFKINEISCTQLIQALGRGGQIKDSMEVLQYMDQQNIKPNDITYTCLLSICADLGDLEQGKQIHDHIINTGIKLTIPLETVLIKMYSKCGSLEDAQSIFDGMQSRNVITWTAMISAYGQHGRGKDTLDLFHQMQQEGLKPNDITFVSLLNGLSHSGLVNESLQYFNSMQEQYQITPNIEHHTCVVDTLGRAGRLEEAENFVKGMKEPNIITWVSLLGACRWYGDVKRAEYAAENAFKLNSKDASVYVLLANVYSAAGRWDDAEKVRKRMKDNGIMKTPGQSWIDIDSKVHSFVASDKSHPQSNKIYAEWDRMNQELKEAGHIPDTRFVLHDVSEEEKEHLLCSHSEKLAIVLGLISTPPGTPLFVMNNLRVCRDCHTVTKFISKLRNRVITVRDANRFHQFKDGECSCKDYW